MSNKIYFTPGPTQLYHTFENHFKKALFLDIPSISHRSTTFIQIMEETTEVLKELLGLPEDYHIYFLNAANETWDRILQNLVSNYSHHFVNGAFSKKFYDFALAYKKKSTLTKVADGASFNSFEVPENTELIGITKNETSVGYNFTEEELSQIRKKNPNKLIALDVVSAVPSIPIDFKNVDTAYFSVQKSFGMPAGLGVWIVNEKCHESALVREHKTSIGSYRSLPNLKKFGDNYQTPETPNMLFIYILGRIAQDMVQTGIKRLRNETIYKSTILNQVIENHPSLVHFVKSKEHFSKTTLVAETTKAEKFKTFFKNKGLILGSGYGIYKNNHIRIANFPAHSKESIEMVCDLLNKIE